MFIRNILSFLRIYYVVIERIILDRNRKLEVTQLQPPRKEEKSCPGEGKLCCGELKCFPHISFAILKIEMFSQSPSAKVLN